MPKKNKDLIQVTRCEHCRHWIGEKIEDRIFDMKLCEIYKVYKLKDGFCDVGEEANEVV